jgi:hypothetical protein
MNQKHLIERLATEIPFPGRCRDRITRTRRDRAPRLRPAALALLRVL